MSRKRTSRWIFLSITYPEQEWPILLQKGIIPFLESSHPTYLLAYLLHFGKDRGDHIGISCEVRLEEYRSFVESAEGYFSAFLRNFPGKISKKDDSWRSGSLFMNFPANLVCHSLHKFLPTIEDPINVEYIRVWHESSVHLKNVFRDEPFDKEDMFTIVLYLNLSLLLSFKKAAENVMERRASLAEAILNIREYKELFYESELSLRDVLQDCINITNGVIRKDLETIAAWFHVFYHFLKPMDRTIELQSVVLEDMLICIRRQLNTSCDGRSLIDYFIDRMLQPAFSLDTVS